ALLVFDDVFVPWENVFCHRNLTLCRDQWWLTPSHSYGNHQAQVRYSAKLRFLMGLTKRLCEITGIDAMPPVQIQLEEMAEFAGRHEQYEKFYGGASFLVKQNMARAYDFAKATTMVERALNLPEP